MGGVELWCLCDEADALFAVFLDVGGGAGVDKVYLEVGEGGVGRGRGGAAVGEVPVVDIVCA